MNQNKLSIRYARALFELSKDKNKIDTTYKDILLINKTYQAIPDFGNFLVSPIIKASIKKKTLDLIFGKKIEVLTKNFLNLIIDNSRENFIFDITRRFIFLYKREKGIKTAVISTASKFNKIEKDRIVEIVGKTYNSKVELEEKIKEELIGGFILRVDDKQYDASVSNQLNKVKKELTDYNFEQKF